MTWCVYVYIHVHVYIRVAVGCVICSFHKHNTTNGMC